MPDGTGGSAWTFYRFGLLVTGMGEEAFMPMFLRSLTTSGDCTFQVIGRVDQRSPRASGKKLRMTGSGQAIPDRDTAEIGLPARNFLQRHPNSFVVLIDDLEYGRRGIHGEVFERYRVALDGVLTESQRWRASVHFLVNMLEAYYFAHAEAISLALGVQVEDFDGDVEDIRHPKGMLKELMPGFNEITHGRSIVSTLDGAHILRNPQTCASLRTLFKWCILARRGEVTDRFQARDGRCSPVTEPQLALVAGGRRAGP